MLSRAGQALLVSMIVATLCFFAVKSLPGDAAGRIAAARYGQHNVTQELIEEVRQQEGLDQPPLTQYLYWLQRLVRGDFGYSQVSRRPVWEELIDNGQATLVLGILGWAFSYLISIPLGIMAALSRDSALDRIGNVASSFLIALPPFVIGTGLIGIFAISLHWFPSAGDRYSAHLVLPVATIALSMMPYSFRVIRDVSDRVIHSDYVIHAQLQGLNLTRAFRKHGPRNIGVPIVTFATLQFLFLVENLVVVETLFNRFGLGSWIVQAVLARDINVIVCAILVIAVLYCALNFLADLTCMLLDPRIGRG